MPPCFVGFCGKAVRDRLFAKWPGHGFLALSVCSFKLNEIGYFHLEDEVPGSNPGRHPIHGDVSSVVRARKFRLQSLV
jgi:hypothetical protein